MGNKMLHTKLSLDNPLPIVDFFVFDQKSKMVTYTEQ